MQMCSSLTMLNGTGEIVEINEAELRAKKYEEMGLKHTYIMDLMCVPSPSPSPSPAKSEPQKLGISCSTSTLPSCNAL